MGKANITKKRNISIKGVLDVNKDDNQIYIIIEDGETWALSDLLNDYNDSEVVISVSESIDFA